MELQLLGEFRVTHDDVVLDLGGRRRQAVLAVLVLNAGRTVSRQQIAQWAWPGDPPDSSGNLIANYVSGLRQSLRPAGSAIRLVARPPGFAAELDGAEVDTDRFAELVRRARGDLDGNEPHLAADRLRQALDLWRGTALTGLDTPYLGRHRAELENARRSAAVLLARVHLDHRRPDQAVELLRGLQAEDPGNEPTATLLVQALTAAGDGAAAADLAVHTIRTLRHEGREPGPALKQAHSDALRGRSDSPGDTDRRAPAAAATRLNQLPLDTRAFTGREHELAQLLDLVGPPGPEGPEGPPGTVVISAIDGMGGVGKTALALHAAHVLTERFPDGQLFVDLQGVHERTPREPGDVLAEFLQAFGLPPGGIPAETAARAAAFRDRLAGTRTLVLLDNAGSEEQIRPLLPGTGGCLVLITSRLRLKGLDDAYPLNLDVLPTADAVALFRSIATPGRAAADDPLLEEIVTLCGRLPLAVRITAALLRGRRSWTLHHLAARLRASRADLTGFFDGDRDLASVFDLSYRTLDRDRQQVFRLLGLIPGPDTDAYAAAALLDTDPDTADRLLQDLVDRNLLAETAPGRYRLHDLLRLHAGTLAHSTDPADRREAALDRLLHYYAHTAQIASAPIARIPRPAPGGPPPRGPAPDLADPDAARAWLRAELPNLDAAHSHAHAHRLDRHTSALAAGMAEILFSDGPWTRALEVHRATEQDIRAGHPATHAGVLHDLGRMQHLTGDYPGATDTQTRALEISRRIGDRLGEANSLNDLGHVRYLVGDNPGAVNAQEQALEVFRRIGNRFGEANVLFGLGQVRHQMGDVAGAVDAHERALEIFGEIGNRTGEANTLNDLGRVRHLIGDLAGAVDAQERVLRIYREIGSGLGEANTLNDLGRVRHQMGDVAGTVDAHEQALAIYRQIGNRLGEANTLNCLGHVHHRAGEYQAAVEAQERALEIYRQIGNRGNEAWALNYYAATIAALGDRPRAFALYHQALAMHRELHKPDDEGVSLEGIADHHLATGEPERGVACLNEALEIYRRLGMPTDIERVQARLAGLGTR